jgi:hypothetical protein
MSRGLGREQLRVLSVMNDFWWDMVGLKQKAWGMRRNNCPGGPVYTLRYREGGRENHHHSFKRALDSLVTRGLAEVRYEPPLTGNKKPWAEYRLTEKGLSVQFRNCTLKDKDAANE